jgi:hypothetical protein
VLPFLDVVLQTYINFLWHQDEERELDQELAALKAAGVKPHKKQPYQA